MTDIHSHFIFMQLSVWFIHKCIILSYITKSIEAFFNPWNSKYSQFIAQKTMIWFESAAVLLWNECVTVRKEGPRKCGPALPFTNYPSLPSVNSFQKGGLLASCCNCEDSAEDSKCPVTTAEDPNPTALCGISVYWFILSRLWIWSLIHHFGGQLAVMF